MSSNFCQLIDRKAKKPHKCVECRGEIKTGEKYAFYSGVWESQGFSVKLCLECKSIRDRYTSESNCMDDEMPYFGGLADNLFESGLVKLQNEFNANLKQRKGRWKG